MPVRGEVASPQLLADFARAQKAYLDKKIEFERQRRASGETAASVHRDNAPEVRAEVSPAPPATTVEMIGPIQGVAWSSKSGKASRARYAIIAAVIVTVLVLLGWLLS